MEHPFILVDANLAKRQQFDVTVGHQPLNAVFIVTNGSYKISMNGKHELMQKGDIMIFSDYTEFDRSVIEPLEFIYLKFKINPKCPVLPAIPYGKITFKDKNRIQSSTQLYLKLLKSNDKNTMLYKQHILEDILYQCCIENLENDTQSGTLQDKTVLSAVEFIQNNINKSIDVSDLCKNTKTNPSTLNFKFKKYMDCSPGQYILRCRIDKAKYLLTNSTYSIGDISNRCGFCDLYYFSSRFKKYTGESPSSYRNNNI